ncbi:hypothetical protein [Ferrimonas lipolytica]|uniref:PilZ domain-containing protein n=1 Tax=Ferrimonas lipolytica TaxID=2724191 RepID=A0A6H1UBL7_9GAMM|nr:hypothetical protein [Ferrimonas lipolytica]QIZ75980.1 hypothetical protein HER31_03230 [Ferrimonas lipolytica]
MSASDESFFSVASSFTVLIDQINPDQLWLDEQQLITQMPTAFRLMSQVTDLERECLPLLQNMEKHAKGLAQYLKLQATKIDLVLQQQLAQDPSADFRCQGQRFGGSGVSVLAPTTLVQGSAVSMRIFIDDDNLAVFAHGEVMNCSDSDAGVVADIQFSSIVEAAQEQLVRASLQVQQRQLRARADKQRGN